MNIQDHPGLAAERRLPFECVALVLQGGGALGAYQAGVICAYDPAPVCISPCYRVSRANRATHPFRPVGRLLCQTP